MKLSKRLQAIYDMVPSGVVADVGSDHGKLIISLFENGVISKGYAIENKKGPFNTLKKALEEHHVENNITAMFSDGISELPSDVDIVVIAGMGGQNVIDILKKNPGKLKNVKTIIVDAHNAIPEMRKQICKMGYVIADEDIVYEAKIYYEIIKFISGECKYLDEPDFEFGPILRNEKSLTFKAKYQSRIKEIDNLLSNKNIPSQKIERLNSEKERIRSML
ncbi:MAG: SAM-dependent methyltransferase [Bacilli bacterium]|nr:SAM-dependent methyltransferase [Bacilli bacterium]